MYHSPARFGFSKSSFLKPVKAEKGCLGSAEESGENEEYYKKSVSQLPLPLPVTPSGRESSMKSSINILLK